MYRQHAAPPLLAENQDHRGRRADGPRRSRRQIRRAHGREPERLHRGLALWRDRGNPANAQLAIDALALRAALEQGTSPFPQQQELLSANAGGTCRRAALVAALAPRLTAYGARPDGPTLLPFSCHVCEGIEGSGRDRPAASAGASERSTVPPALRGTPRNTRCRRGTRLLDVRRR